MAQESLSLSQFLNHRLVSLSQPCPGLTAAAFLQHGLGQARVYWADGHLTLAGFGTAAELFAWGELRFQQVEAQARQLFAHSIIEGEDAAAPRLFGGFAFRDDFTPDNTWSVFHPAHFILPHFQFVQNGPQSWLTLNALLPPDENPALVLPDLREALAIRAAALRGTVSRELSRVSHSLLSPPIHYPLPYPQWAEMIGQATRQMRDGEMAKVVLARVGEIRFAETIAVDTVLADLTTRYPNCITFLFEPRPHHAFFGATPELLAQVQGTQIETMALAGSISRGRNPQEDDALAQTLLADPKSRHEHDVVVQSISRHLTPLTQTLNIPPTDLLKLSYIQHLHTPITGTLRQKSGILPLVETLHPTPALGGSPRSQAMAFIREVEPVTRGWYAAPIGWIDPQMDGAFAVAIRSAVTQRERVWFYAGAGIVSDSLAQAEWGETELKFRPIIEALNGITAN